MCEPSGRSLPAFGLRTVGATVTPVTPVAATVSTAITTPVTATITATITTGAAIAAETATVATEAATAIVNHGFTNLKLDRVYAAHFTRNPASGRVLQKAGMFHEGSQDGPTIKWGQLERLELYGISKEQFGKRGS